MDRRGGGEGRGEDERGEEEGKKRREEEDHERGFQPASEVWQRK